MTTSLQAETKERLLEVAVRLFAGSGYAKTTILAISEAAGANIAAVNYHYGDKETLYLAALRRAYAIAREIHPVLAPEAAGLDAEGSLRHHVRAMIAQIFSKDEASYFARMFAKEIAEPSFAIEMILNELLVPNKENLRAAIIGILGPGASERDICLGVLSVVSQFQFFNFNRMVRDEMDDKCRQLPDPDAIAEHITAFSLAGLGAMRSRSHTA